MPRVHGQGLKKSHEILCEYYAGTCNDYSKDSAAPLGISSSKEAEDSLLQSLLLASGAKGPSMDKYSRKAIKSYANIMRELRGNLQ